MPYKEHHFLTALSETPYFLPTCTKDFNSLKSSNKISISGRLLPLALCAHSNEQYLFLLYSFDNSFPQY